MVMKNKKKEIIPDVVIDIYLVPYRYQMDLGIKVGKRDAKVVSVTRDFSSSYSLKQIKEAIKQSFMYTIYNLEKDYLLKEKTDGETN